MNETMELAEQVKITDFPSRDNVKELETFVSSFMNDNNIVNIKDVRGLKTLQGRIKRYLTHKDIADRNWQDVQVSVCTVNGERISKPVNPEDNARVFLNNLSTNLLRKQCHVYGVDYDSFENIDDIIEELVSAMFEDEEE